MMVPLSATLTDIIVLTISAPAAPTLKPHEEPEGGHM